MSDTGTRAVSPPGSATTATKSTVPLRPAGFTRIVWGSEIVIHDGALSSAEITSGSASVASELTGIVTGSIRPISLP